MDEATNISGETGESTPAAAGQPSGPAYTPHETDRGPSSGATTRTTYPDDRAAPQNDVPHPERIGEYDRENILSYGQQGAQLAAYDFNGALKSVMDDPGTYAEFASGIPDSHAPAVRQVFDAAIEHDADYVIEKLVEAGRLPAELLPPKVDPVFLAEVFEPHHHEFLSMCPLEEVEELSMMEPAFRDALIDAGMQRYYKSLSEHEQRLEEHQFQSEKQLADINDEFIAGHYLRMEREFQPFGADKEANKGFYRMLINATAMELMNDGQAEKFRQSGLKAFYGGQARAFNGSTMTGDMQRARDHFAQWDKAFGELLNKNIELHKRNYREDAGNAPAQDQTQYIN